MSNTPYAVILLAAGQSKRMGQEKAFLAFDQEKTFLSHLIEVYGTKSNKLIVVKNSKSQNWDFLNLPSWVHIVTNQKVELGRSYSIFLAMQELSSCSYVFLQNIDNPFTTVDLITKLLNKKDKADYVFPKYKHKGGHPLLLNRKLIDTFLKNYSFSFHFREFLNNFTSLGIEVESERFSFNINTPQDYDAFLKIKKDFF